MRLLIFIAMNRFKVTQSEAFRAAHRSAGNNKPLYLSHPQFEGFEVLQSVVGASRGARPAAQ